MKSIIYIYLLLIFFVYLILCSIVFMMINNLYNKKVNDKVEKLSESFGKEILNQLYKHKNNIDLSQRDIDDIAKKLNKKAYEKVFNNTIILFNNDPQNYNYVKNYMEKLNSYIQRLIKRYGREDIIKKVYITFLMGQYKVDNYKINNFLLDCIKTNSLYLRFNALNSIGEIGNVQYFIKALLYISQENAYLNDKILIDIIDNFEGNMKEINDELFKNLEGFNDKIQCIIIEHFKNNNSVFAAQEFAQKLSSPKTDKEVKISILKYFNIINYEPGKEIIIDLLSSEEWECRALAAKTLAKYYSQDTVDKLLISITDSNWFVRLNSAMSLLEFDLGEELINHVLEKGDKYSIDILFYAMFVKNKITYDEYIEKVNVYEAG